ncbi:MAG: hypothetical protein E7220_02645 [Clostridiales bacterium]|nr:hypothetical protein [Clostridiales bacterium]
MNKINRELKRVIQDEKKIESQIENLTQTLEELVVRRQQLSREAVIKAFESKKLERDMFFDVVEGIASGKVNFAFLDDDSEGDEEDATEDSPENESTDELESDADITVALQTAIASGYEAMYEGGEDDAE